MPPFRNIKRGSDKLVTGEISPAYAQPSTWKVVSVLAGSAWFTYNIYSAAKQIWSWVQYKLELRNHKIAQERPHRLRKRQSKKLQKRGAPFDAAVNVIYWVSRIVNWIYHQTDMIPVRIQNGVNREYTIIQDAKWEVKQDEADDKVKIIIAKEFPEIYKKKYLDPFEEGSELYAENNNLLNNLQTGKVREIKVEKDMETRAVW